MADNAKMPRVTPELIEYLVKLYPDRSPDLSDDDRVIWMRRGQVGVVRHLQHIYDEQNKQMEIFPQSSDAQNTPHLRMRK